MQHLDMYWTIASGVMGFESASATIADRFIPPFKEFS
jgi:hypothetical protein